MREALAEAIRILEIEAEQLRKWAEESRTGGWSTHQVGPMEKRAEFLENKVNRLKVKLYEL